MGLAKHRRKKSRAPVDYGIIFSGAAVIAGAVLILVHRARRGVIPSGLGVVTATLNRSPSRPTRVRTYRQR